MANNKKIIVTAEIPEEFLEDWRVFVVIRGEGARPKTQEKGGAKRCQRSKRCLII